MNTERHRLEETLPGAWYLDDVHLQTERERIFRREWFCAGRVEGLEEKGDYRLVNILGDSILLVRDVALRAFHNVAAPRLGTRAEPDGRRKDGHSRPASAAPITPGITG